MREILLVSTIVLSSLVSFSAIAGSAIPVMPMPAPAQLQESEETVFSIGLRFSFSDMAPDLVGSVRNTTTDTDSDVRGIQGDIAIPLTKENQGNVKIRVLGLFGDRDVLGQAGLGYNFGTSNPMLSGGVQIPYFEGGVNLELDGKVDPYVGVNTFDQPEAPTVIAPMMIVPPTYF